MLERRLIGVDNHSVRRRALIKLFRWGEQLSVVCKMEVMQMRLCWRFTYLAWSLMVFESTLPVSISLGRIVLSSSLSSCLRFFDPIFERASLLYFCSILFSGRAAALPLESFFLVLPSHREKN